MRRRSFARPNERLRGAKRRLRALGKWADSFEGWFPTPLEGERYWNCKIPVLDRLVSPPMTDERIQSRVAVDMLRAAANIQASKPNAEGGAIVTALLTYPDMFASELCVFFDQGYLDAFFSRGEAGLRIRKSAERSLSSVLGFVLPEGFDERGYDVMERDEDLASIGKTTSQWWSYRGET